MKYEYEDLVSYYRTKFEAEEVINTALRQKLEACHGLVEDLWFIATICFLVGVFAGLMVAWFG